MRRPCVYILTNGIRGTLYVGVTSDVVRRVWEHRNDVAEGFTRKYGIHMLVHVEFHETMPGAILREKQIKKWKRDWKLELIEAANPDWLDLYQGLAD